MPHHDVWDYVNFEEALLEIIRRGDICIYIKKYLSGFSLLDSMAFLASERS